MKKGFAFIIALSLVLTLAGCTITLPNITVADSTPANNNDAQVDNQETVDILPQPNSQDSQPQLIADAAKAIAFAHAGVEKSDISDLEVELDKDDSAPHYDISFDAGTYDYEYEINAYTGKILKDKKEKNDDSKTPVTQTPEETQKETQPKETQPKETKKQISSDKAKSVAFDHAGVKESAVSQLEVELDKDDGTLHYDISFDAGKYEYEYEIDAYSGDILKNNKEKNDDYVPPATEETKPKEQEKKTEKEAKKIAFDHAGVKESAVSQLEVELDKDDGTLHYDISFDAGKYEYEYEIDAYSGDVLKNNKEKNDDYVPPATEETKPKEQEKKTEKQVKKIVLDHAGVKESAVYDWEAELDKDDGKVCYEVSFSAGKYDYEYEVEAYTGKILHHEKEIDD